MAYDPKILPPGHDPEKLQLIAEGKTKLLFRYLEDPVESRTLVVCKNLITAFNGKKSVQFAGQGICARNTTVNIFRILENAGIPNCYIHESMDDGNNSNWFNVNYCQMLPIEWVVRRVAYGSFLKRNPHIKEGTIFTPPILEMFYKDDAADDPMISEEDVKTIESLKEFKLTELELETIKKYAVAVFEILEKYWSTKECTLVDLKLEFGRDKNGAIVLADVIDNDSWRLWEKGSSSNMRDKQLLRNYLKKEDQPAEEKLNTVRQNYEWVSRASADLANMQSKPAKIVVVMGSVIDLEHSKPIVDYCKTVNLDCDVRIASAHKSTERVLKLVNEYSASKDAIVFIAVAGKSNGLGPVIAGNTLHPVINCPVGSRAELDTNIWSSLDMPSGLSCTTVLNVRNAAMAAARIIALSDIKMWAKLKVAWIVSQLQYTAANDVFFSHVKS